MTTFARLTIGALAFAAAVLAWALAQGIGESIANGVERLVP